MSKQEPKMIRFIPSGKRLPYWDKYEFECVDCGTHYFSGAFNNRTRPYCAECCRKHDRERNAELKKAKQKEHDRLLRNQVIDEVIAKYIEWSYELIDDVTPFEDCLEKMKEENRNETDL